MHDPRLFGAQIGQHVSKRVQQSLEKMPINCRRTRAGLQIGPRQIENRTKAKFTPHRRDVLHCRMKRAARTRTQIRSATNFPRRSPRCDDGRHDQRDAHGRVLTALAVRGPSVAESPRGAGHARGDDERRRTSGAIMFAGNWRRRRRNAQRVHARARGGGMRRTVAKHGNRRHVIPVDAAADVAEVLAFHKSQRGDRRGKFVRAADLRSVRARVSSGNEERRAGAGVNLAFVRFSICSVPICNPARVRRQLNRHLLHDWLEPVAHGCWPIWAPKRPWIVHGTDGLDELTTTGPHASLSWSEAA